MASNYTYVTYIRSTPAEVWSALTTPEFMRQYWFGVHFETDWKPGSPWKMLYPDGRQTDHGTVLECVPQKRLVLSWRNDWKPEFAAEGEARCVIELEPGKGAVKLSIHHSMARENSGLIAAVSDGWPRILSNLKSLLESGSVVLTPEAAGKTTA
jgi:uncharacterized protein YndB with AHSA1/START domain